jgi:hypothetical protein
MNPGRTACRYMNLARTVFCYVPAIPGMTLSNALFSLYLLSGDLFNAAPPTAQALATALDAFSKTMWSDGLYAKRMANLAQMGLPEQSTSKLALEGPSQLHCTVLYLYFVIHRWLGGFTVLDLC